MKKSIKGGRNKETGLILVRRGQEGDYFRIPENDVEISIENLSNPSLFYPFMLELLRSNTSLGTLYNLILEAKKRL
jgi:hypothetical protein